MTTESAMDAWIEAQKVLWESWGNLALSTPSAPFSSDLIERWQELARQSFGARTAGAAPVAQSVADQFLATQSILLREPGRPSRPNWKPAKTGKPP
jgi:hypothetical protein